MLKVAVWGIGEHAVRNTIPALDKTHGIELYGFYSRDENKVAEIASKWNKLSWSSADEMLDDPTIDVVYISTPIGLHYEQVSQALSKNKHVFCEKSLTTSGADTSELFQLAESNGLMLFECNMYLFHEQFIKIKKLITDGCIGQVNSIVTRFGYPHLDNSNIRYDKQLGGGALYDAGVYTLSSIFDLFGTEYIKHISYQNIEPKYDVDVGGSLSIIYSNGLIGTAMWGMGREYRNEIDIWGSDGIIKVDRAFSKPEIYDASIKLIRKGGEEVIQIGKKNHFVNMFEVFARMIKTNSHNNEFRKISIETARIVDLINIENNI